ncbi:MAG TPA: DUF3795 domain-containing protein [Phycisphaerae bacterium]|nr:DUF3795 domain-containing protein [Phycisphaerae bacterium]
MGVTRRLFLVKGASAAAAGVLGTAAARGAQRAVAEPAGKDEQKTPKAMIGACGLACKTCPLMKAGKCKGCASGKEADAAMLEKKPCPVLKCAAMKKIDYCGTGCKMFAKCPKLVGRPYDKTFLAMIDKRLNPKPE